MHTLSCLLNICPSKIPGVLSQIAHNLQVILLIDRSTLWQKLMMHHAHATEENFKQNTLIQANLAKVRAVASIEMIEPFES